MKQSVKHIMLILVTMVISLEAHAQNYNNQQRGDQQPQDYSQQQSSTPPRYQPAPGRWKAPQYRARYNYFKGSLGFAAIDDYSDGAGEITFESSALLPLTLAYGVSNGNLAFEAELGFSAFSYSYDPYFGSVDPYFDGSLGASKLMFNGMFKTSQTGSNLYIGGGIGFVSVVIDGVEDELTGSSFATQFILGGEMRSSERSSLFIEYKNLGSRGLELENAFSRFDFDFRESSLNIGMKLYF